MDHPFLQKLEEYFKNTPKEQIEKDWLNILKDTDSEAYYKRKYKDSLERMKSWVKGEHPECFCEAQKAAEFIFPELKESEDERIRKTLIELVRCNERSGYFSLNNIETSSIIAWLEKQKEPEDKGEISDGYHTFNELYKYRMLYNAAFFNLLPKDIVHKSKRHHDGEECFGGGWFIVIANLPTGQISNHYELKDWDLFQIPEKEIADEWDGHTPQEAAERLHKYLLEKQGEQKEKFFEFKASDWYVSKVDGKIHNIYQSVDKIEPKFKVGDWVVSNNNGEIWKIGARYSEEEQRIYLYNANDTITPITLGELNNDYRLWTIADAKDGDVLFHSDSASNGIFIFKEILQRGTIQKVVCYCDYDSEDGFCLGEKHTCCWADSKILHPATKEQRDLLFQKMKEAGYQWDADKKELKKIEQKPVDKVGPKFKVGNWYQCTKDFFGKGVTFDKNTAYYCANEGCLQNEYGCHIAIVKDLYDNFKLWTIQDAEDGDVLLEEETGEPFIYNGNRATYFSGYFLGAHCGIYNGEFNPLGNNYCWGKNSCPATNEQRDLLFQKMKDAGYKWDAERKELKKIES